MNDTLCARCASQLATCCQTSRVFVTAGDIGRIRRSTGRDDFHELRPFDTSVEHPLCDAYGAPPKGPRRVLAQRAEGGCVFLGECGCTLDMDSRPLLCRVFPFRFDAFRVYENISRRCPRPLLRGGESLFSAFQTSLDEIAKWHRMLCDEFRREASLCVWE